MFTKSLLSLIFVGLVAFSQEQPKQLEAIEVVNAMSMIAVTSPANIPGITGATLITEVESNGSGRKVWLAATLNGTYIMQATAWNGVVVPLGQVSWEGGNPLILSVLDTIAYSQGAPFSTGFASVDVFRIAGGRVERDSVNLLSSGSGLSFSGEGKTDTGAYFVSFVVPPGDGVTVSIGRNSAVFSILAKDLFGGSIVFFPPNFYLPSAGPTTLTVCQAGVCNSIIYNRKVEVFPTGKG